MKRIALLALLLLLGAAVYGDSRLSVNPSTMKDGETKTLVDGNKTITITRHGDDVDVQVEGAGKTHTIVIGNAGGDITIDRDALERFNFDFKPPHIVIDRAEIERHLPKMQSIFVCPKDHTVLRVPEDKADHTYKCPVDGTPMEKRRSRAFGFWFDGMNDDGV